MIAILENWNSTISLDYRQFKNLKRINVGGVQIFQDGSLVMTQNLRLLNFNHCKAVSLCFQNWCTKSE